MCSRNRKFDSGIDPVSFYGFATEKEFMGNEKTILLPENSRKFRDLFAPSTVWKNFRKQQHVLDFISSTNCDLFPFTYQTNNGDRLFLAAHPVTFWFIDEQRPLNKRHNYEIIREFAPCKLYFDLEFNSNANSDRNGDDMVKIFLNLVFVALKCEYGITCDEKDVLNLNSSTVNKFSVHLIFPNVIFENNYVAGNFVKQLCYELELVRENTTNANLRLLRASNVDEAMAEGLFVNGGNGQRALFCDQGVYTKNRHFRLYKSSKHGKNVPLLVSKTNSFPIQGDHSSSPEELIFLSSLITYCNSSREWLLTFESTRINAHKLQIKSPRSFNTKRKSSPFSDIDECIKNLVSPGHVYKSVFFPEKNLVVYDIVGNRYCHNIGREHKSNNVKYIVDMKTLTYYQKCHDPDCVKFRSERRELPASESVFLKYSTDDDLLLAAAEKCEMDASLNDISFSFINHENTSMFPQQNCSRGSKTADVSAEDELLVDITEHCELSASLINDWNPIFQKRKLVVGIDECPK